MTSVLLTGLLLIPIGAFASAAFASLMRRRSPGQQIRDYGPSSHAIKAGTPTMGGLMILTLWLAGVGLLSVWRSIGPTGGFVLATAVVCSAIGAADDLISMRRRRSAGLSGPAKLALTSIGAAALWFAFRETLTVPVAVPFTSIALPLPPAASLALVWIVLLSTTNGMNLTDGLDGLASGVAVIVLVGLILLRPTETNLTLIVPLIGALLGFLAINVHPARLFLGDVGSFLLGGVIAAIALAEGLAFVLPILAGVLVLEVGSVILQVGSLRLTGRRVFRMSPLHHHFERSEDPERDHILPACQWPEGQVTVRFWILSVAFVGLAVLATKV